jgi:hypothetical protein
MKEVRTPRMGHIDAIDLGELWLGLLLNPKAKEF